MDDSCSDFQVKKIIWTSPKKAAKPVNKPKPKKPRKKTRGQKDIRALLKKNELVAYTKDFDNVCRQSGIDVDSEQLELAVTLSKSVQLVEGSGSQTSQLSSQERTSRIRTTLQEYGFTVPEIKIINPNKKLRKLKRNFKLLLLSEAERQQLITDKYSQILFHNTDDLLFSLNKRKETDNSDAKLHYLTTSVPYESIRNNSIFYLDNLSLEQTSNKGCLLKDWDKIPGRPVSPKLCKEFTMDISEIICSQDELDILLSGSIRNAKNIIKDKLKWSSFSVPLKSDVIKEDKEVNGDIISTDNVNVDSNSMNLELKLQEMKSNHIEIQSTLETSETARSCSPDIFDDDISDINRSDVVIKKSPKAASACESLHACVTKQESGNIKFTNSASNILTDKSAVLIQNSQRWDLSKRVSNDDAMEMTECVGVLGQNNLPFEMPISQSISNATRRKSNDFMDITACITNFVEQSSKKAHTVEENIDLTQSSNEDNLTILEEKLEKVNSQVSQGKEEERVDLTQSSTSTDELPFVQMSKNKSLDDTIILNDNYINIINRSPENDLIEVEPMICTDENKKRSLDLNTATPLKVHEHYKETSNSSFDEFLYDHSDEGQHNENKVENCSVESLYRPCKDKENCEIDLTQKTSSSEEVHITNNCILTDVDEESQDKTINSKKVNELTDDKIKLGKNYDDVSIDYDEIYESTTMNENNSANSANMNEVENIEKSFQSSQDSEVFEILDKEFDYSMNRSRFDEPVEIHFGGISIMDNLHNNISHNMDRPSIDLTFNKSMSDSYLPAVNIKKTKEVPSQPQPHSSVSTPCKEITIYDKIKTPNNSEYLVKTHEVTPMADYASMSSPERNKELDKYGLKPLKRKRAIQLLTHIYNQTHPIVEHCNEAPESPSKKPKLGSTSSVTSPRKQISLGRNKTSPRNHALSQQTSLNTHNFEVKENIYEITTEVIPLREIECSEVEWVFQKREKAKVHSCRVPLHIAFHNYVSCRRGLRESILRYEPINIDLIHKGLVANGHRYDPKDLLQFLDKKCITVKTADNNSRNNRK